MMMCFVSSVAQPTLLGHVAACSYSDDVWGVQMMYQGSPNDALSLSYDRFWNGPIRLNASMLSWMRFTDRQCRWDYWFAHLPWLWRPSEHRRWYKHVAYRVFDAYAWDFVRKQGVVLGYRKTWVASSKHKLASRMAVRLLFPSSNFSDAIQLSSLKPLWIHALHYGFAFNANGWNMDIGVFVDHAFRYSYFAKVFYTLDRKPYAERRLDDAWYIRTHFVYPHFTSLRYQKRRLMSSAMPDDSTMLALCASGYCLFQTHYDKHAIPARITAAVLQNSIGWNRYVLDDDDARVFLLSVFPEYIDLFDHLKGAHRADVLRYLLLYRYGGVYLDIKTIPMKPLDALFPDRSTTLYTALGETEIMHGHQAIWQGVLAAPRGHSVLRALVNNAQTHFAGNNDFHYFFFIKDFYHTLQKTTGKDRLSLGYTSFKGDNSPGVFLYNESCVKQGRVAGQTCDELDRYGLCCYITYEDTAYLLGRDSKYPWDS